jgi:CheY-like chemotaxis protein
MGAKRALIVDDSKSARLFLARVLEKYEIDVDSAESAEAAIDYLNENRPDVIFMDHLMPGMDGLQAVQHIKNDPRTATIPIMMYTSQEGELYLGQARALGAIGVLPKQIRPADVSKVLYQLHLVPDRRTADQSSFTPANAGSGSGAEAPEPLMPPYSKPLTDSALREHFAELRRALVAGIDTQTDRITAEVRALLLESLPENPPPAPPRPLPNWAWLIAAVALAIALLSTTLWWRSVRSLEQLTGEVAQLRQQRLAAWPGAAAAAAAPVAAAGAAEVTGATGAPGETRPIVALVPYGSEPLGGARLDVISKLLGRLVHDGRSGLVEIRTYAGRFCLVGSAAEGYSLAPEEMLVSRCDVVGNPYDEALSLAQRTPLALANLVADVRKRTNETLDVAVAQGDAALAAAYPPVSPALTAGEWNHAAIANNRIEIRVR